VNRAQQGELATTEKQKASISAGLVLFGGAGGS